MGTLSKSRDIARQEPAGAGRVPRLLFATPGWRLLESISSAWARATTPLFQICGNLLAEPGHDTQAEQGGKNQQIALRTTEEWVLRFLIEIAASTSCPRLSTEPSELANTL